MSNVLAAGNTLVGRLTANLRATWAALSALQELPHFTRRVSLGRGKDMRMLGALRVVGTLVSVLLPVVVDPRIRLTGSR